MLVVVDEELKEKLRWKGIFIDETEVDDRLLHSIYLSASIHPIVHNWKVPVEYGRLHEDGRVRSFRDAKTGLTGRSVVGCGERAG